MKKIAKHNLDRIKNGNKTHYLPRILTGIAGLGLIGLVIYFLTKKKHGGRVGFTNKGEDK